MYFISVTIYQLASQPDLKSFTERRCRRRRRRRIRRKPAVGRISSGRGFEVGTWPGSSDADQRLGHDHRPQRRRHPRRRVVSGRLLRGTGDLSVLNVPMEIASEPSGQGFDSRPSWNFLLLPVRFFKGVLKTMFIVMLIQPIFHHQKLIFYY